MLFSSVVQAYRCSQCHSAFSKVIPTSILPIGMVMIIAGVLWSRTLVAWIKIHWIAYVLGFILSIVSLYLVYDRLDRLLTPKLVHGVCPHCGGKLKGVGGGFLDGVAPTRVELLTYALTLLLAFGIWLLGGDRW